MRVTIIPVDGFVSVDGEGFSNLDLSFMDATIHAVQWYGDIGEVEKKNNRGNVIANEEITSLAPFQEALDAWQVAKTEADASPPQTEETEYVPQSITRRQCAIELRERNLITAQEALDMTRTGIPPAMVQQIFNTLPPNDKIIAETDFAADTYLRSNPLLIQIMTATGASDQDIDDFFISAEKR